MGDLEKTLINQLDKKLDKLDTKLDNIIESLKDDHGRITKLESFAGFIRTGAVVLLPILIKVMYDLIMLIKL
jgi:uncharacterized protein YaaQ